MKRHVTLIVFLLTVIWPALLVVGKSNITTPQWTQYDATRRVPFLSDTRYETDDYDRWVCNTGQPSSLYFYGSYSSQESGSWSLNLPTAWTWQRNANGIKVALVDINNIHGQMGLELISKVAPGAIVTLYPVSRYYADVVGLAMTAAVADGNQIIVFTDGYSTPEPDILNACLLAQSANVAVICATPDSGLSIPVSVDEFPDYPTSFGLDNILGVAAVDMAGDLYWSGYGTNVVAGPGRRICAAGFQSSGTSYAAPIVAGVLALVLKRNPSLTAAEAIQHIRNTADQLPLVKRLNAVNAIQGL